LKGCTIRGKTEMVSLDAFLDDPIARGKIGAVKMDVEGYEHGVLRGGMDVLLRSGVPFILTEFTPSLLQGKGGNPGEFVKAFLDAGYALKTASALYMDVNEALIAASNTGEAIFVLES
jgi:hypothetical protein